jgi:hypothetical protein
MIFCVLTLEQHGMGRTFHKHAPRAGCAAAGLAELRAQAADVRKRLVDAQAELAALVSSSNTGGLAGPQAPAVLGS